MMRTLLLIACVLFSGCNMAVNPNLNDNSGDGNGAEPMNSRLVVFSDPNSDFSTTDVNDVNNEIVQFDSETNSIIWAADGTSYDPGSWTVDGNLLTGGGFQVRFGSVGSMRQAYFTETDPATICDIETDGTNLFISPTNVRVPEE